jgi:hypothetical protein
MALRILIVKIGGVSDIVHTMPMLSAIHEAEPNAHVSWLVGESCADILRAHPRIQKLFIVDDERLYGGGIVDRLSIVKDVFGKLDRGYDLILIGHRDPGYSLALRPFVWGPLFQISSEDTSSEIRNVVFVAPGSMHESMAMRKLLIAGLRHAKKAIKYSWTEPYVHIGSPGVQLPEAFAVLHFAKDPKTHEISPLMFELAAWVLRETKLSLVALGGKDDWRLIEKGLRKIDGLDEQRVHSFVGENLIRETLGLIRKARLFIGPAGAPLHMADSLQVRAVGLYGETIPTEQSLLSLQSRGLPNPTLESVQKNALELLRMPDPGLTI